MKAIVTSDHSQRVKGAAPARCGPRLKRPRRLRWCFWSKQHQRCVPSRESVTSRTVASGWMI